MDASSLVGNVIGKLDLDLVAPIGLGCVRSRTVESRKIESYLYCWTWVLSVNHQACDVDSVRRARFSADRPIKHTIYTGDGVVCVVICVVVPVAPGLATWQRLFHCQQDPHVYILRTTLTLFLKNSG
jgi:hypothetical protein